MYHEWLKRAWQGGLRLMVMLAVNSETLCVLSNHRASWNDPAHPFALAGPCNDWHAIDRQIQAAKDHER
jgi:hypothetical protein